jgi:hypothetical protein
MKTFFHSHRLKKKSKLAVAYREGLVSGFEDGLFKPHNDLSYGEAYVLAIRLSQRGARP